MVPSKKTPQRAPRTLFDTIATSVALLDPLSTATVAVSMAAAEVQIRLSTTFTDHRYRYLYRSQHRHSRLRRCQRRRQHSPQSDLSADIATRGDGCFEAESSTTPVTVSPANSIRLPIQQAPPTMEGAPPVPPIAPGLQVPRQRSADGIGRSMPSRDGSRVSMGARSGRSRFSESIN